MQLLHDYLYRTPDERLRRAGRCRVRIYKRNNGSHTVLLTELNNDSGESITVACERIAMGLVASKGLNPKTTQWIQHEPPHEDAAQTFDELKFTWSSGNTPTDPQWRRLTVEQAETMTGESLSVLNGRLGDNQVHHTHVHQGEEKLEDELT